MNLASLLDPSESRSGSVQAHRQAESPTLVLAGGRPAGTVEFECAVVDFFVSAADLLGVPKSVAAIYGIIFASPVPIAFAEIEARLDISKGSISQGLRVLREVGALREVSGKNDKAELFTPDLAMRKLASRFLENRLQRQLVAGSHRLDNLVKTIPAEARNGEAAELRRRIHALTDWHRKASALLPLAKTFLELGS